MNVKTMAQETIKVSNEIYSFAHNEDNITDILSEFAIKMYNEGYKTANNDAKNIVQQAYHEKKKKINEEYGIEMQKLNKQLYGICQDIRKIRI